MSATPAQLAEARAFAEKHKHDIIGILKGTDIDETGVGYDVRVSLASLAKSAFEVGEDEQGVWSKRVEFGRTDFTRPAGMAFVEASIEQEEIADAIVAVVWPR